MAVELIKDQLKIDQLIGKEKVQSLVEGEISVPQSKPKISELLTVDGSVEVTSTKVLQDKILVSGLVNFKILYNAEEEDQSVHSLDASTDFREEIVMDEVVDNAITDVRVDIEHIEFVPLTDYKVGIKTVLNISSKIISDNKIDIVKDIKGSEDLQILKETIKYNDVIGSNTALTIVKEAFELHEDKPDILDILRIDTKVYEKEAKVVEGKIIVAGVVECFIMYFADDEDNKISYITQELPFTHFVEVPGALNDMDCILKLQSSRINYDIREDLEQRPRIIDIESTVKIEAKVYTQTEKEVTVDTYSTVKKFDIKKQKIFVTENISHSTSEEQIKGVIDVSQDKEAIKNVCNINGRPVISDHKVIEGKAIVEGLLEVDLLYLSQSDGGLRSKKQEIPFRTYIDIEDSTSNLELEVDNLLSNINYKKTNNSEVEVEATIKNVVSINRVKNIDIVTEALETEELIDKSKRPSITIYIVQKSDTIWDIAKRYNTTVEEIVKTNDIVSPDNIMPGEKIIIEKQVNFKF
ncbi:peptidoglycan-binding LysM [Gottschalkia purinilytica]|uniref:Peptidoglycan-binding LysM n=1 Tax=Gottschalkia purinilytica TaxID=1503 RepID=A0A0L0WE80_GOTPU|nr:SPOCS domain-containing protein [Gottschalkia purinilytica]KNF09787.1 peptidoglycan-binding LysM [Gottschalkia purinilytica]